MRVRLKCECLEVQPKEGGGAEVYLAPVHDLDGENARFFAATPWGSINLGVLSPTAAAQFKEGQRYYVDFVPAITEPPK